MPSKAGKQYARCSLCSYDVKVATSSLYDVNEHIMSNMHKANLKKHEEGATMRVFFKPQVNCSDAANKVTRTEVIIDSYRILGQKYRLQPKNVTGLI